jgi:CRISPR/Cas system-associated exonuclease Cas4 (RecB family)
VSPIVQRLSYSSISAYLACPFKWYLSQVERVPRPVSEAALLGSAVHEAVGQYLIARLSDPAPDLDRLWRAALGKLVRRNEQAAGIAWVRDQDAVLVEGRQMLVMARDLWLDHYPAGEPSRQHRIATLPTLLDTITLLISGGKPAIERLVRMAIPGIAVPFVGFVDWVEAGGIPADLKTTSSPWSVESANLELQPTFYLAALQQMGLALHADLLFRHYVLVRGETPKVQVIETRRRPADLEWALDLARGVWRAIENDMFHPNPTHRWCDPRYCEYWGICRGKGGGVQSGGEV